MARVAALSTAPPGSADIHREPAEVLRRCAGDDRFGVHRIGELAGAPGALVRDTSRARHPGPSAYYGYDAGDIPAYLESLRDSAFVLCPRGRAPTSLRLFEVMQLGRVPVIVADRWLPPEGPDWDSFSLRVPEAELGTVPDRIEALAGRADAMGARARAAWEDWFSEEVTFHRVVETCLGLRRARRLPERVARWKAVRHLADPELRAGLAHRLRERLARR